MRLWPFHLAAGILLGMFLADAAFGFLGISPQARLALLGMAVMVFLFPHLDAVMGGIQVLKASFKQGAGWGIEIRRKVAQADLAAEKAVKVLAKEFPLNLDGPRPIAKDRGSREPWREMIRVSDLLVRKLAERMGEDPDLLGEIPLPTTITLAAERGTISRRQATALNGFYEARQTLIEICFTMKGETPVTVNERALQLMAAGEQIVGLL